MKYFYMAILAIVAAQFIDRPAHAAEQQELRIYEVNKYGQTQYHKGYIKVEGDKAKQVNKYGQTQNQKPSLIIKKNK